MRGFIALVSAVIISLTLLAIVLSLNFSSFFTRFNILDSENKKRSGLLADACLDIAHMKLTEDSTYLGGEIIRQGDDSCRICPVTTSSGSITVTTRVTVGSAVTNLTMNVDASTLAVESTKELPTLSTALCPGL